VIRVIGVESGAEAEAADVLKAAAEKAWPWLSEDPHSLVQIVPNAQCHGESPRDIDILLLALLDPKRAQFQPAVDLFLLNGTRNDAARVCVRSLCLCIEVKDHRPQNVRFAGTKAEVRYSGAGGRAHWHSATQQSEKQKYSLLNYLRKNIAGATKPYVCNLIWLRNIPREELPHSTTNLLPATFTWSGLLNSVAANSCVWLDGNSTVFVCPSIGFGGSALASSTNSRPEIGAHFTGPSANGPNSTRCCLRVLAGRGGPQATRLSRARRYGQDRDPTCACVATMGIAWRSNSGLDLQPRSCR